MPKKLSLPHGRPAYDAPPTANCALPGAVPCSKKIKKNDRDKVVKGGDRANRMNK